MRREPGLMKNFVREIESQQVSQIRHLDSFIHCATDIATCMYYTGIDPSPSRRSTSSGAYGTGKCSGR